MGTLNLDGLPEKALLAVDSPPIIYVIEGHDKLRPRFRPIFELYEAGRVRLAVSPITIAEVLTGPLKAGDEALAKRYRRILDSWEFAALDADVAESAARLRATLELKLADALQAAAALSIGADALVTHERDFSRLKSLRVIS
jgi:predicted nucleic acid-binding protein